MTNSRPFPTTFAILPSDCYVFAQERGRTELTQQVVADRTLGNGLRVTAANSGLLAFEFAATPLGAFNLVESHADGIVPDAVTASRERMLDIQAARLKLAMFVTACIYGRHAHLTHSSVRNPRYPGLDEIFGYVMGETPPEFLLPAYEMERLAPLLRRRVVELNKGTLWSSSIPVAHFAEGIDLADRLLTKSAANVVADYPSLLVMTYQAMVLHAGQHAGASIALSAMVLEVLLEELFHMAAIVKGATVRLTSPHSCGVLSKGALKDMRHADRIAHAKEGGLIPSFLAQRMDDARLRRNALMHKGQDARPTESGEALTAVRDVLRQCTGEEFELCAGWSYRM